MLLEEAGDAADRILGAVAEVDAPVAVEIDRIAALAAGHELRDADGAGEGTADNERVQPVFAGQEKELLQFLTEEIGAPRVVEGEGGQRLEHAEASGIAPVLRFDTDDGDDDFLGHAVHGTGLGQGEAVFLPEADAVVDAAIVDEARAVAFPGALQRRRRGLDQLQHLGVRADLPELLEDGTGVEGVALRQFLREGDDRRVAGKGGGRGMGEAGEGGGEGEAGDLLQGFLRQGRRASAARRFFSSSVLPP